MQRRPLLLAIAALLLSSCGEASSSASSSASSTFSSEATSSEVTSESSSEVSSEPSSEESSSEAPSSEVTSSEESSEESSSEQSSEESSEQSSEQSSEEPSDTEINFKAPITTMNDPDNDEKEFPFHYSSTYFSNDNATFDPGMASFAYAISNATASPERAKAVYDAIGFGEVYDGSSLTPTPGVTTIGYAIGTKNVDGVDQILVSLRGENYGLEWVSNFDAFATEEDPKDNGDHYGLRLAALEVHDALRDFVSAHNLSNPRYLITGYSRGGGVADLLSAMLIDDGDGDKLYGYCFSSPASMATSHKKAEYAIIHDILNGNDFIPMLLPEEYGFTHPGTIVDIGVGLGDVTKIFEEYGMYSLMTFDERSDFATVKLVDEQGNPRNAGRDAFPFLLSMMTRELTQSELDLGLTSFHTKEDYRDKLMPAVKVILEFFFSTDIPLSMDTISPFLSDALAFINVLAYDDGHEGAESPYDPHALYSLLKKIFASVHYYPEGEGSEDPEAKHYDETKLSPAVDTLQCVLRSLEIGMTNYYFKGDVSIDEARMQMPTILMVMLMTKAPIVRHTFDTSYVLLRHYLEQNEAK